MRNSLVTGALLGLWFASSAPARAVTGYDQDLGQTTACMLKVLKTVPGVSDAHLGISVDGGSEYPFLEYRATEQTHWLEPTRFTLQKGNSGQIWFQAMLPGIGRLDTHVTDDVVKKWREQCGVVAVVLLA